MNVCHHIWLLRWVLRVKVRFSYARHQGWEGNGGEREVDNRREGKGEEREEREEERRKRGVGRGIMNNLTWGWWFSPLPYGAPTQLPTSAPGGQWDLVWATQMPAS